VALCPTVPKAYRDGDGRGARHCPGRQTFFTAGSGFPGSSWPADQRSLRREPSRTAAAMSRSGGDLCLRVFPDEVLSEKAQLA